jgi:transcriptional regulator with XRE-family HTH domain
MFSMERFSDWLLSELKSRNMSQSDLAHLAGLGRGTISNIMTGTRNVGQDTLTAIARALHLPTETVFRAAGLLPPIPPDDAQRERLRAKLSYLTDDDLRQEAENFLDFLGQKQTQRSHAHKTP